MIADPIGIWIGVRVSADTSEKSEAIVRQLQRQHADGLFHLRLASPRAFASAGRRPCRKLLSIVTLRLRNPLSHGPGAFSCVPASYPLAEINDAPRTLSP